MSPTNDFRYTNITKALDEIDRNDRLRTMWELAEFAIDVAVAALVSAQIEWWYPVRRI